MGGGVLILDNVDFSGSKVAVAGVDGNSILAGGSVVANWVQGNAYTPSKLSSVPPRLSLRWSPSSRQSCTPSSPALPPTDWPVPVRALLLPLRPLPWALLPLLRLSQRSAAMLRSSLLPLMSLDGLRRLI